MILHKTEPSVSKRARVKRPRLSFARAIEASAEGAAPTAARLWRAGWNKTDKGDLNFTPRSAKLVMQAYEERGNPLAWYYEHEDRIPLEKRGGAPMRGVCSAPTSELVIRDGDGGPECWAENIGWTDEAKRQIETGERRQLSPIAAFDEETREIVEILNVSLCAEGATHGGTLLASANKGEPNMDELEQKLLDALDAGDFEAAENIVQAMEAADGGQAMAKMARACMAKMKAAVPPVKSDDVPDSGRGQPSAATKIAASRGIVEAEFSRKMAALDAATAEAKKAAKDSRRATVQTLIAANRDFFDVADEREHALLADPEATQRHIASMQRKAKTGVLVASREAATGKTDAKPPKDPPVVKTADEQLTPDERIRIAEFNRGQKDPKKHITAEDFLASKTRNMTTPPSNASGGRA